MEEERLPLKGYTIGSILFPSASAQDLGCLEMDKEGQDEFSPRGVLDSCIQSLEEPEMDSSNNTSSPETRFSCSNSKKISRWHGILNMWGRKSMRRLPTFPSFMSKESRRKRSERDSMPLGLYRPDDKSFSYFRSSWKNFSLRDLQSATNNFSHECKIGKGGYAEVYKGLMQDGMLIAIKRLTNGTQEERIIGFLSEIGIIAHVDHPNIAKLIGYGIEGGLHLVVQLSQRGSLASHLHGSEEKLDWNHRYKIALGAADGLVYLHENCQRRIIHRDIKSDNILLTEDYEAQICDFGLAKWLPKQWTHCTVSKFEGTFGYFAPEYFMHGIVDEKIDVFAFGVLLLELITGRRAIDHSHQSIVIWAKPLLDDNNVRELVDPSLGDAYNLEEMERAVLTASLCIEQSPILRPQMSQVALLLRDDAYRHDYECTWDCRKQRLRRTYSEELLDSEEYNTTRYFSDLTRLKQIALDH